MSTATTTRKNKTNNKESKKMSVTTQDIVRKTQFRNGQEGKTNAYKLAKFLTDRRRKDYPTATRQEIMERFGFDPAPYAKVYDCFESVERGVYTYTGEALEDLG